MNLIDNYILKQNNLLKKNINFKLYKSFKINKKIYYGSYININNNKYIFYREDEYVQRKEIREGIACVKHQNMSGSDMGDDHKEYFAGEAALKAAGKDNTMNQF